LRIRETHDHNRVDSIRYAERVWATESPRPNRTGDYDHEVVHDMDDFRAEFAKVFKKSAIAEQLTFGFDRP
jgi:hypothetical protein